MEQKNKISKKLSVVTVAVGKVYYLNLAENLLRSFLLWNKNNDIHFLLVTDDHNYFKAFVDEPNVTVKNISLTEAEKSFTSKFLLFDHVVAQENLFIDCDCIIYSDLRLVFEKFKAQDFSVVGNNITAGDFFADVAQIIQKFDLAYLPKFVGSVYYFKNNEISGAIFDMAKSLKNDYDQLGFIRLRGKENEEPLFATAMAKYQQIPIKDDGTIKADAMFFDDFSCNVQMGRAVLQRKKASANAHSSPKYSQPAIVHYNDRYTEMADYLAEQYRLRSKMPTLLTNVMVVLQYKMPSFLTNGFKDIFRPIYHKILGPSKVRAIKRID